MPNTFCTTRAPKLTTTLLFGIGLATSAGCEEPPPPPPSASVASAATTATPTAAHVEQDTVEPTAANIDATVGWLRPQLMRAASDPTNPWALAHGLLAFGAELQTDAGKSAVDTILGFAEPSPEGGYAFPRTVGDKPLEPHPYLFLKDLLDVQITLGRSAPASDGKVISVGQLADAMWKSARLPDSDSDWHDSPWMLQAMLRTARLQTLKARSELLQGFSKATLARLVADDAPLREYQGPPEQAFAQTSPLGLAKRNHSHIYGHACGGFHLVQAVIQAVASSQNPEEQTSARAEFGLLSRRHAAERALYASMRKQVPALELEVSVQELKFFGHLLETLGEPMLDTLVASDAALRAQLGELRSATTADLLGTVARLRKLDAYGRLDSIGKEKPQLRLDLIGDGCHALRGLARALARPPG